MFTQLCNYYRTLWKILAHTLASIIFYLEILGTQSMDAVTYDDEDLQIYEEDTVERQVGDQSHLSLELTAAEN